MPGEHVDKREQGGETFASPHVLDDRGALVVSGGHFEPPRLHNKDVDVRVADPEEELASGHPQGLDAGVDLGEDGGVELAEHVEGVEEVSELRRNPGSSLLLLLLKPILGWTQVVTKVTFDRVGKSGKSWIQGYLCISLKHTKYFVNYWIEFSKPSSPKASSSSL